jgi:hypothetical protein
VPSLLLLIKHWSPLIAISGDGCVLLINTVKAKNVLLKYLF